VPEHARINRRQDGRYSASLQVNGRRAFIYGKTEAEVRQKLKVLDHRIGVSGSVPTPGRRTVDDLLDAWLDVARPSLKPKTLVGYEDAAQRHIRPTIGHVRLSKLEPIYVQRLYSGLADKGMSRIPAQIHAILHRACKLGVMWGWLAVNPCDRVLPPKYKAARKEVWTAEQTGHFLHRVAEHRFGPLFAFLALTGARLSEALALQWDDISGEVVTIRRSVQRLRGEWVTTDPKTEAGQRTLAMPSQLVAALKRERARQAERRLRGGSAWRDEGLVFSTIRGGYIGKDQVAAVLRAECERLGLRPLTPHGLRHLSASLLLSENVPLPNVSQRLGHADPSITARVYSHVVKTDDHAARVLEALTASGAQPVGHAVFTADRADHHHGRATNMSNDGH
jgi:integrase